MKQILLILSVITLFACSREEQNGCENISYNTSFIATVGQKYCLDDNNYIMIDSVFNELCPCNAICIWEGEFILKLKVMADTKEHNFKIGSSENTPDPHPFGEYKVKFLSITPDKCDSEIQKDFRVGLVIKK